MKCIVLKIAFPVLLFIVLTSNLFSQDLSNSNWHFGEGIGLFHDGIGLVSTASEITTMDGVTPATISDDDGNLVLYSNGQSVWNADHEIVDNGTFENLGLTNVFCPVPNNPDQYYLFRSSEWGVDYSLVDASLNDGSGGIIEEAKEVFIQDHKSELLIAHKAGTFNFWLLVVENSTGGATINIQSYEISDTDLTQEQSFSASYLWAGWYAEVDDAKISPDCSKIAVLHKGHYLSLYEFDNEDGTISNNLPNAVNTQTSFTSRCNMEFAPGSEYIYIIGDFYKIDRYSLENWNQSDITASQTTIAQGNFGSNTWRDIKLGPYGNLYVYNEIEGVIESVIDPDVEGNEVGVEYAGMDIEATSLFFPNTPNLSCTTVFSPSISANGFCLADTTWMSFEMGIPVEEISWDFGSDDAIFTSNSENPNWVIYSEQGTYDVTLELFFNGIWHSYSYSVSIGQEPDIELGDDVTLCQGESVTFSVPNEELYQINWSNGLETAEIEVSTSGDYSVIVNNLGCISTDIVSVNVIPQILPQLPDVGQCADEESVLLDAGNESVDSYIWSTGSQDPFIEVQATGTYWVTLSNECFTLVDTSNVILVDFPETLLPEDFTICENESVLVEANYSEGGEIDWSTGQSGAAIEVNEPGTYSVIIDHSGCIAMDTVHVTVTPSLNITLDDYVFCDEGQVVLDATHPAAENYIWSDGSTEPALSVSNAGTYWVQLSNNCFTETDTSVVDIVVFPDPLLPGDIQACGGDTVSLISAYQEGSLFWNTGEESPSILVTESGLYSIYIENMGCIASDEVMVDFQPFYPLELLEVPNVFTPNSDGNNPVFRPFVPENRSLELCDVSWFDANITIYNRWGAELHKDICFWDGTNQNGADLNDGTYFYLIDLSIRCYQKDENLSLNGSVTLLR